MSVKEYVVQTIETLGEDDLQQLADYVAFLKFRARLRTPPPDPGQLRALYAEFAQEDHELAEAGMADYARSLHQEDEK